MARRKVLPTAGASEEPLAQPQESSYVLRLYVAGISPQSVGAIASVKQVCEQHLHGRYQLEAIDLYQHPELARGDRIVVAPTLVKALPLPLRRITGDMSDVDRLLAGLDLRKQE